MEAYAYDANGNRTLQSSTELGVEAESATYTSGDQLDTRGNTTYSYDANGRLSQKLEQTDNGPAQTDYVYGSQGQLLRVDTPEKRIEYRHNALGQRVAKLVDGQIVERYLWQDLTTLLATYDGAGNLKQRFEYAAGHTPARFTQNGQRYYIQADHLGSPRVITDASGSVVRAIRYDSYGNIVEDTNPDFRIPFGFAGGLYDADTGLVRFGHRDYDPYTGRWTARDPIGFGGGDTNLYGYVIGDPLNWNDMEGTSRAPRPRPRGFGSGGMNGGAGGRFGQVIGNGYYTQNGRYVPPSIPIYRPPPRGNVPLPVTLVPANNSRTQEVLRDLLELYDHLLEDHVKEKLMCELNPMLCSREEKGGYCPIRR